MQIFLNLDWKLKPVFLFFMMVAGFSSNYQDFDTLKIYSAPGYIITNAKDTLYGTLEYRLKTMYKFIDLKDSVSGELKQYHVSEVLKYGIGKRIMVRGRTSFVELICKGNKANLYKLTSSAVKSDPLKTFGLAGVLTGETISGWMKTEYFYFKKEQVNQSVNWIVKANCSLKLFLTMMN